MRNIEIDFAQPLEKVLATVRSLPAGCSDAVTNRLSNEAELKRVIRGLYEAANDLIAPPVYAFLKAKPFSVTTQTDLLIEAATRLIAGPLLCSFPGRYGGMRGVMDVQGNQNTKRLFKRYSTPVGYA